MGTQREPDRFGEPSDLTSAATNSVRGRVLARAEDALYLVVSLLLTALAMTVVVSGAAAFIRSAHSKGVQSSVTGMLNDVLLVLMLVELLHTVRISLRAHQLVPEPFLIVGPHVKRGFASEVAYTHSSYLKSLQKILGVPVFENVSSANDFSDFYEDGFAL